MQISQSSAKQVLLTLMAIAKTTDPSGQKSSTDKRNVMNWHIPSKDMTNSLSFSYRTRL